LAQSPIPQRKKKEKERSAGGLIVKRIESTKSTAQF